MPSGDLFATPASTRNANSGRKTVLAHCDGGARGNPGPAGYGAVITAEDGTVLAELSEFLGFKTNNFAEYSGLLAVLQWAVDNDCSRVNVVSDSLLMVNQVQGKYKVNSPDLKPLHEEAKRRIAKLDAFSITHALRHKNKTADRLANEAMDRGMGRTPAVGSAAIEGTAAPAQVRAATPYPSKATEPPMPRRSEPHLASAQQAAPEMLRGFVRDGAVHLLGGKSLPDGVFVKVIRE